MARIADDELERLKSEISLERIVRARGIELRKHGADLIGLCPFHDDHEPSLVITPQKNLWHCLGACQTGGSVIDWTMKTQGVSFRHAVELLRADFFPLAASSSRVVKVATVPILSAPVSVDMEDRELFGRVVDYYHQTLKASPEALGYLERRGIKSAEAIDRFKLGFANRTLGLRLPAKNRKEGEELRTRLGKLGIIREETGHEHFNGSLVIPIVDAAGEVVEMYGRKITPNLRPGTPLHLYLPGPHRGVWNLDALRESKEIILCEALIDALTFWCAGIRNVTTSYGVGGFTNEHLEAFKSYGTEHVLIAYDRDEAGDRAADALGKQLLATGIAVSRIEFPKGMDANEYALKVQPASRSLSVLVRAATWIGAAPRAAQVMDIVADPKAEAAKERVTPPPELTLPLAADPSPVETNGEDIVLRYGDRRYRVRGLAKNTSFDSLRVNVLVTRDELPDKFFIDTFDLYSARQRAMFEKQAASDIGMNEDVLHRELGQLLRALEQMQEEQIKRVLEPKEKPAASMPEAEQSSAMALLRDPNLVQRILADFAACGVVGEETNKLMGYVAAVSRKLEQPLAIVVQSSSAAGKSALMEAVLALMPEEERVQYSAMTGQSLFYMGETDLKHKILAIAEEEGAERASYALKLLQSEGRLTIASTGKDPHSGKLVTHEYHVEGPVMIFLTTTAIEIDEELLNRCIVLTVDEDREQTRAIHRLQRESQTLEGLLARRDADRIRALHRNAQRLLQPILVANPYARELTFIDGTTRTRRDHMKYLTLIRTIALLHQHQRERKTIDHNGEHIDYIEVTPSDIDLANSLAHEVLGRSLDELPPQTRRLLTLVDQMVTAECERLGIDRSEYHFTRRHAREVTHWGETQLRIHLDRLVALEYLLVHRGGRGQSFVYELLYNAAADRRPSVLADATTTETSRGTEGEFAGGTRPQRGAVAPTSRSTSRGRKPSRDAASSDITAPTLQNAHLERPTKTKSYRLRRGNGRDHASI
ncbi:MAG TPA: CHC2 zinc finger domain-containing protein [Thermoanaerobaculia bacterium]|nr:CHC2 zinc finger domain-containing protein [Thermoanaerobaculia bacterium]